MKKYIRLFLAIVLMFGLSPLLYAQEEREGDLAVLDVQVSGHAPGGLNLDFLSRKIREAAVKYTNFRIMTKENIFAILQDKNIDLSKCTEAECAVEYGRILQADNLIVTTLTYSEGVYFLIMEMFDVRTAAIVRSASKKCKGCGFEDLLEIVNEAAKEVFTGEVKEEAPVAASEGLGQKGEYGSLYIDSIPQGAEIYLDGTKTDDTTPALIEGVETGKRRVTVGKDMFWEDRNVVVKTNTLTELKVELKEKGRGNLKIESEPGGATVYIDGKEKGRAPMIIRNLSTGTHMVALKKPGYIDTKEEHQIAHGMTEKATIYMRKQPHWRLGLNVNTKIDFSEGKYLTYSRIDLKYRYFSILYAGGGIGFGYSNLLDYYSLVFDVEFVEARIPLWNRFFPSLGTERIAVYGGVGGFVQHEEVYGLKYYAGLDIFWFYIETSYNDMGEYKGFRHPGVGQAFGFRFNW